MSKSPQHSKLIEIAIEQSTITNYQTTINNQCLFVFVSVQEYPWIHLRRNYAAKTGNDRFEGFCVDLLKLIAQQVDFTYEIMPVSDNMAGTMSPNGSWSGVMKQIVSEVNE